MIPFPIPYHPQKPGVAAGVMRAGALAYTPPSVGVAFVRAGPVPLLGKTWVSQPQGCMIRRAGPELHSLQHWEEWAPCLNWAALALVAWVQVSQEV